MRIPTYVIALQLSFLAILFPVHAEPTVKLKFWRDGATMYPTAILPNSPLVITYSCLSGNKDIVNSPCIAAKIIPFIASASIPIGALDGGRNPGAVVCEKSLGGSSVTLLDTEGNENSFCRFCDGSLLSNSSIAYYFSADPKTISNTTAAGIPNCSASNSINAQQSAPE